LSGQEERQDAHAFACLFHLLGVLTDPGANHEASVPGGIVPNQEPVALALGCQALTTLLQELTTESTHWPSRNAAQPDLRTVGLVRGPCLPQDDHRGSFAAVAGQQHLAASQDKGIGRTQPSLHSAAFVLG
jgi:hypothetical protein